MLKLIHTKNDNNNYGNYNDILMPTLSDNNILFIMEKRQFCHLMLKSSISISLKWKILLRSLHTESEIFAFIFSVFFVFLILSYQNACYGCEDPENRTWSEIFLWWTNVSEAVCKHYWHNVRSNVYFNMRKFRMIVMFLYLPVVHWEMWLCIVWGIL